MASNTHRSIEIEALESRRSDVWEGAWGISSLFSSFLGRNISTLHKLLTHSAAILLLSLALNGPTSAASPALAKGGELPVISLPVPKDLSERNYLGLSGGESFKIPQIKAQGLLIKIFNLYCPICQSTASAMADLYHQIESNPDLKNKIKLIGIGVGNNLLEVDVFKQHYNILFPIFPDENYEIHQALGETRTPFFIAIRMDGKGSHQIVHTHLGGLTDMSAFLKLMVEAYGIKQEDLLMKQAVSSPVGPSPPTAP